MDLNERVPVSWRRTRGKVFPIPEHVGRMEIGMQRAETRAGSGQSRQLRLSRGGALRAEADSLCDVHCSTCRLSQRARQDDLRHEETACRHQPYTAARIYSSPLPPPPPPPPTRQPPPYHPARACDRELAPCSSFRAHCSTLSLLSNIYLTHHTARRLLHLVHASRDVANGHSFLTSPPPTLSLTFSFYQQQLHITFGLDT